MNELFEQQHQKLEQWSKPHPAEGWISGRDIDQLREIERQQAEAIFSRKGPTAADCRLLWRHWCRQEQPAESSRRREHSPYRCGTSTSHEVTLFLHRDYLLGEFPADLPLEETRIAYHADDRRRLIAWLDMPDFDSVEEQHRVLVQAWLPYVDWLIYVVSPGRYQDDIGWRFVQKRGGNSWLFVMNQWDGSFRAAGALSAATAAGGFGDRSFCVQAALILSGTTTISAAWNRRSMRPLRPMVLNCCNSSACRRGWRSWKEYAKHLLTGGREHRWTNWRLPGERNSQSLEEVDAELTTNGRLLAGVFSRSVLPWRAPKRAGRAYGQHSRRHCCPGSGAVE